MVKFKARVQVRVRFRVGVRVGEDITCALQEHDERIKRI